MWVRFTADFDFSPAARRGMVTLAYKQGTVANVTRECARLAIAAEKAVRTVNPNRSDDRDGSSQG